MKLRAILEGRWYTGRNAHQIWAEWAVWARWQILNGSQFFFHFNDKWLSVDNISWIYYQICLDKNSLLIQLQDCCAISTTARLFSQQFSLAVVLSNDVHVSGSLAWYHWNKNSFLYPPTQLFLPLITILPVSILIQRRVCPFSIFSLWIINMAAAVSWSSLCMSTRVPRTWHNIDMLGMEVIVSVLCWQIIHLL